MSVTWGQQEDFLDCIADVSRESGEVEALSTSMQYSFLLASNLTLHWGRKKDSILYTAMLYLCQQLAKSIDQ